MVQRGHLVAVALAVALAAEVVLRTAHLQSQEDADWRLCMAMAVEAGGSPSVLIKLGEVRYPKRPL